MAEIPKDQKDQWEYVRDYVKEMNENRRQQELREQKRLAKKNKYKHAPGEPLWKFIWKELRG